MKLPTTPTATARALMWFAALSLVARAALQAAEPACAEPIREVMSAQAAAWNEGDIDGFMSHYWNSDELTFCSSGKTVRGWQATRERYHRNYGTPAAMGKLTFDDLEITALGSDHALVLGKWRLAKALANAAGNFSLVFQQREGRWAIIHDHTSRLPKLSDPG